MDADPPRPPAPREPRRAVSRPSAFLLRHPRRLLALAALLVLALAALGSGVEGRLTPTSLAIPGTPSARSNAILRAHFGDSAPFAILLRGPAAALDRQGPALIRVLRRDPRVTTLSPWDRGSLVGMRPAPRRALILADFHVGLRQAVRTTVPDLNRILAHSVHPPVRAVQSGYASVSRALQEESIDATEHGELIAIPVLLIVLLLVFRSPIAAAIPLGFGAITVLSARGVLYILTTWLDIDAFALTVCTMMGLALGVDYALLVVSRFREELAAGADPLQAALRTRATAGRTTIFAAATLALSMLVALFVVPGSLLASLAGTVAMVVAISVLVSTLLLPALLAILGPKIDRWRIGPAPNGRSRLTAFLNAALRRPAPVAALIGAVLLLLAAPALALRTGSPGPEQLAHGTPARLNLETIDRTIGPGWDAPFQIVATARDGPITEPDRLAALGRTQRRIAALPGVQAVIGPAGVGRRVAPLRQAGDALLASGGAGAQFGQLGSLGHRLASAAGGVLQLRRGLSRAASGAGLLATGSQRATAGSRAVSDGIALAGAGARRSLAALEGFTSGAHQLAGAERHATLGATQLRETTASLIPNLRVNALRRSRRLQRSLHTASDLHPAPADRPRRGDRNPASRRASAPHCDGRRQIRPRIRADPGSAPRRHRLPRGTDPASGAPYAPGYTGLPAELSGLREALLADASESRQVTSWLATAIIDLRRLTAATARLTAGLREIESGGGRLAGGSAQLADASSKLQGGLLRLLGASVALSGGVQRLGGGAAALQRNLAAGFQGSAPLGPGLNGAGVQMIATNDALRRRLTGIRRASPRLFDSGDFVLSVLSGAPPAQRRGLTAAIDLDRGGQAASIFVALPLQLQHGRLDRPRATASTRSPPGSPAKPASPPASPAAPPSSTNTVRSPAPAFPTSFAAIALATFLVLVLGLARDAAGCDHRRPQPGAPLASPSAFSPCSSEVPADLAAGRPQLCRRGRRARSSSASSSGSRSTTPSSSSLRIREKYDHERRSRGGDPLRAREDGAGDHRRRRDHDGRLHRLRRRPGRHRQPARRRSHRRRPARRHRRPHRPPPGPDAAARRAGLVAAAPPPRALPRLSA